MYAMPASASDEIRVTRREAFGLDHRLTEFVALYPDDATCLDRLWRERHAPDGHHAHCRRCGRTRKFHRTRTRASYTCDTCGLHVHPMKGTIFEKSTTPLRLWFYAIYLVASTRRGISARQLERELGVSYRTARRMIAKIRTGLTDELDHVQPARAIEPDATDATPEIDPTAAGM
jgi:transposase